ncbi:MAG: hypothetical protein ACRCVN_02375 [Spirochaetia bacterium]
MPDQPWPKDWGSTIVKTANSSCTILHHGAHIVSCKIGGSEEIFWLSPLSEYQNEKPVRGGNPLCWPNFGAHDHFPKHGLARLAKWKVISLELKNDISCAIFSLCSNDLNHPYLPDNLDLIFTVELTDQYLKTQLKITNNSHQDFIFSESQHAYFAVSHIKNIGVLGLKGHTYIDRMNHDTQVDCQDDIFHVSKPTDIIFLDHHQPITIVDSDMGRQIIVAKSGAQHAVVWNPYQAMATEVTDMAKDAFEGFICIEPCNVTLAPTTVKVGQSSTLEMVISVSKTIL